MDGDRPMPAAAVAAVLGDDDLLREILLRLGFPTCLVHAAIVSKRWLHHASDPAFLRRFRDRNPPRLLGFCLCFSGRYRFVPFPQPPELAAPIRRATSSCAAAFARRILPIKHCRNGRLIIEFFNDCRFDYSLAPLLAGEAAAVLPTAPLPHLDWDTIQDRFVEMFLPEDGGRNGITLLYLWAVRRKVYAKLYVLGSGGWGVPATAVTELELSFDEGFLQILPPIHGKVFVVTGSGYTLGLDLAAASFFTLELPVGVRHNYKLSCAEDSGLYLVSVDGFQLSVWLHRMSGDGNGAGWLLVDTFCIREGEACAHLVGDGWIPPGDHLDVVAAGHNADFVFLDHTSSGAVFYVHLRSRVVEKVHQRMPEICWEPPQIALSPVVMIWPPVFPARDVGHDQDSRGMTPLCLIL